MVYDGFVKGLNEHDLSLEDIKSWGYCGGNAISSSENYFNDFVKKFGHMAHPECEVNCVCGHKIVTNCYITNKDFTPTKKMKKIQYQNKEIPILIVGSCCVKQFMEGTKLNARFVANYIEETSVKQIYVLNVIKREKWKQRKKNKTKTGN